MADLAAPRLRVLAAELRREVAQIERTVAEMAWVATEAESESARRVQIYAAAAMLDTFYTGIERALERIARAFRSLPDGPNWHRALLDEAALDIAQVRPPVLQLETTVLVGRYLSFRHRFRNLYLFDLDEAQIRPLVDGAKLAGDAASRDLLAFALVLEQLAEVTQA